MGYFLLEFLKQKVYEWYEELNDDVKRARQRVSTTLITEFSKTYACETLICDLSQVKQGTSKNVKDYIDRIKDLFAKITCSLKAQGHGEGVAIFTSMDSLVFKYYVIGLLPKIKQLVKYEEVVDLLAATHTIERKK